MTFQPIIVGSGLASWRFLQATLPEQKAQHASSLRVQSNGSYFLDKFPSLQSVDAIVDDRRLLAVVLGAYGLEGDLNNKFFIRKVMTDGLASDDALANRLTDHRYRELAGDFDFSQTPPSFPNNGDLARKVVNAYEANLFEVAVGETDTDLRLGLGFARELQKVAATGATNTTMWYRILGSPPLQKVFQVALSLPSDIGKLDIDDQVARMVQKASEKFGTSVVTELAAEATADAIVQRYMTQSQISAGFSNTRFSTALALLTASPFIPSQ